MNEETREIEIKSHKDWVVVSINNRVDSFNYQDLTAKTDGAIRDGKNLAFDLGKARFLSLPSIKYMSLLAESLLAEGRQVALVAPSEKIKRQIHVYASLEKMKLFRTEQDL